MGEGHKRYDMHNPFITVVVSDKKQMWEGCEHL